MSDMHDSDTEIRHEKFPKIPRLFRDVVITEKIDGTNAQVYVREDGLIFAGSRKRWITPENDNYGFAAWVEEHKEELQQLGPGRHYGEWWGQKINRGYGIKERRFSLFNVSRWKNYWPVLRETELSPEDETERTSCPPCCWVVPVITTGPFMSSNTIAYAISRLREGGSIVNPNFSNPEGIVVFHKASGHLFKYTLDNDEPKGNKNE